MDGLPAGALAGPCVSLGLASASSHAGHDWLPLALRAPDAPSLVGTRPGGRLDVLAGGRTALRMHEAALLMFRDRCRAEGVPATLVVVCALFDAEAAGLLDLAASLRATESLDGMQVVLLSALSPPVGASEPEASARAALSLSELDTALSGSAWELPQPTGILSSPQSGSPIDATILIWPSGPRWTQEEAVSSSLDALLALPWLPELPQAGLGAVRAIPVRGPTPDVRERLADRLAGIAVDRWLAPGDTDLDPSAIQLRVLRGAPSEQTDWLEHVRGRLESLLTEVRELAISDPSSAADRVRGSVPALDREIQSELAAHGRMQKGVEDASRRWSAGARAQALAVADELVARAAGGGYALIQLCQLGPELLAVVKESAEKRIGASDPSGARSRLDAATEELRLAIDKPAGLSVRLLGRGAPRVMAPVKVWCEAFEAWAAAEWTQAVARSESLALNVLGAELLEVGNQIQSFEVRLRQAVAAVGRADRAANQRPERGVAVFPGGAIDSEEAAEKLEGLGPHIGGAWLKASDLLEAPATLLSALRDRLRSRLGAAEKQLTLAGALSSLPSEGASRETLDRVVMQAGAPLLGGVGREELVAVLPPGVKPADMHLPEGSVAVEAPPMDDALLVRIAGGFGPAALGLRKAALDEGLRRLQERDPKCPDLLWRRFGAG